MQKEVPAIFEGVFECTLTMITKNFEVGIDILTVAQSLLWITPLSDWTFLMSRLNDIVTKRSQYSVELLKLHLAMQMALK